GISCALPRAGRGSGPPKVAWGLGRVNCAGPRSMAYRRRARPPPGAPECRDLHLTDVRERAISRLDRLAPGALDSSHVRVPVHRRDLREHPSEGLVGLHAREHVRPLPPADFAARLIPARLMDDLQIVDDHARVRPCDGVAVLIQLRTPQRPAWRRWSLIALIAHRGVLLLRLCPVVDRDRLDRGSAAAGPPADDGVERAETIRPDDPD